jgi:hypothetical protein
MALPKLRVWAEEIDPPNQLRLTWQWYDEQNDGHREPGPEERETVGSALQETAGVQRVAIEDDGVAVTIDAEQVSRFTLAEIIRTRLGAEAVEKPEEPPAIRIWAEDLAENRVRLTWKHPEETPEDQLRAERRRVAAWMTVLPAVQSARPDGEGVTLRYAPETLDRSSLGGRVREGLDVSTPLRERADELMRRAPTYGNLARKLAMDKRISPLPDAAKQAVAGRGKGGVAGMAGRRTAMRFIPGAALISRVQALIPVLQELSNWSRESDPAIVEEHLASVGLTRDQLQRDTVTAYEIRFYARDFASEASAQLSERARSGAKQAVSTGRELLASVRESVEARSHPQDHEDSDDPEKPAGRRT